MGVRNSKTLRPDQNGTHRGEFERNKKRIYASSSVCGICGKPIDFTVKYPAPLSSCIDHIIPVSKGGHPSDIDNLQLAHWCCNRQKSDKIYTKNKNVPIVIQNINIGNRNLPQHFDWLAYRG